MPFIISTVTCLMKKNEVLAQAGDAATLISDYGNVVIVEVNGNRFSIKKDNLTNEKRESAPVLVVEKEVAKRSIKKVKEAKPELF
jgi:hypothetical protein